MADDIRQGCGNVALFHEIPWGMEQGIIFRDQGFQRRYQGILGVVQGNSQADGMRSESSYEMVVYSILESFGCRFERQAEIPGYTDLSGQRHKYDALIWEERLAIEVDGCWYHGCKKCFSPLKGWHIDTGEYVYYPHRHAAPRPAH